MDKKDQFKNIIGKASIESLGRPLFSRPGKDIPSGIVVFLVALPLCLGIALASGAPLISGLISGIIGGLVIGAISQSEVSVSGPAASLSAVSLVALQTLDTFEIFLLALFIGGLIQLLLGILKAGIIADYMPTSIIKGLLAAIGLILIFSQIPYALGVVPEDWNPLDYSRNYISNPPQYGVMLEVVTPGSIVLSIISLFILIFWDKTVLRKIRFLPPFLVVVFIGVILNLLFRYFIPFLYVAGSQLVNIPNVEDFSSFLTFPDFSAIGNIQVWTYAFTIALIASIASLLAIEAADNIDPHKRRSPPNRELVAQGIGNTLAGLIGGIPITTVIVRSSVNIEAGAETKLSTIIHGILLLASVLVLSSVINLIPLASLAVILLVVGYKLASVAIFKGMYSKGWTQFIPFFVTTIAILVTDVLLGVLIGTASSVFFLLRGNYFNPFHIEESTKTSKKKTIRLELSNEVSFLNKPAIKKALWDLPQHSKVIIDATFTTYVERDVLEILDDFQNTFARENDIEVTVIGLKESYLRKSPINPVSSQIARKSELSTPKDILGYLMDGNQQYVDGNLVSRRLKNKELLDFIKDAPLAAVINCIDMREPLNMLLNTDIGDLIPLRAAGNLLGDHLILSAEIACRKQGAKLILLMGNSKNSFIREALKAHLEGSGSYLHPLLKPALTSGEFSEKELGNGDIKVLADEITLWNLEESKKRIFNQNDYIREQVRLGNIGLCSAFFDRKTGKIEFSPLFDPELNEIGHRNQI